MLTAKVTGWTDGNCAHEFTDEHGFVWHAAHDAADGTIAIEKWGTLTAGVFRRDIDSPDSGSIAVAKESDTYGVNCADEFAVSFGRWVQNEIPAID